MALKPPPLAVVVYLFNAQQNIQQPALGFDIPRGLHKLGLVPLRKDILLPLHDAVPHEEDLPHLRDIAHVNVASDPSHPPRRGRKRLGFSMIAGTKKYFGMVRKFRTPSVDLSYVRKKKLGLLSDFKR